MTLSRVIRILVLLALPLAVCSSGSAASVSGKVVEIIDGDTFAIVSQNHPLKVKLLAVAAPEKTQAYADIARQHLSDLILDKYVTVRFSALEGGFLLAQAQLGNMDVGAQMIRDGAAWYNKSDERLIGENERLVYGGSQEAARNEKRGLWQNESPVAPWDYRQAQVVAPRPVASNPSPIYAPRRTSTSPLRSGSGAGLSSEDLMGGVIQPGSIAGKPEVKQISAAGSPGRWLRYQPADSHFSILAPSDGVEILVPVIDVQGKSIDLRYIMGHRGSTLYFLMWVKAPNRDSTDASTAADAIKSMVAGINRSTERTGMIATATPGRLVKVADYGGRQYNLNAGPLTGVVRVISKQIGDEREAFFLCVLNGPDSEATGAEFLNSLRILPSAGRGKQQAANSEQ
jgi:endonuclease YncB( thermonuclease family)